MLKYGLRKPCAIYVIQTETNEPIKMPAFPLTADLE